MVDTNQMLESATNMGAGMADLMFYIVMGLAVGGGLFFILYLLQFKHKIRVKKVIKGRLLINDYRFRIYKDSEDVEWYQLLNKGRQLIRKAPPEAIEIDAKGKLVVECYEGENGEIIFAKDISNLPEIPEEILNEKDPLKKKKMIDSWRKETKAIVSYEPLTTTDRVLLAERIIRAQQRKRTDWKQNLPVIFSVGVMLIVVIMLMVMWEDLAKPLLEMKDKQIAQDKIYLELAQTVERINNDVQNIKTSNVEGSAS